MRKSISNISNFLIIYDKCYLFLIINLCFAQKMTNNILEVENVYAGYVQDLNILQGINFCVGKGELVAVIGPNGAGKSTLAKQRLIMRKR